MDRQRVAVVLGGRSSEHEISCLSAISVLTALDRSRYDVSALGIDRAGAWVELPDDPREWEYGEDELPDVSVCAAGERLSTEQVIGLLSSVDVVFPVLHGPWGEDGTIQGLLETISVPYVGSGVLASAAAMDKAVMKSLLESAGLPVGPWCVITDRQWRLERSEVWPRVSELGLPVFVKPARAGSSVGITRVTDEGDLTAAIEVARRWDPRVIVEAQIGPAREIECAVLTDGEGRPMTSVCAEICVRAEHDFYDFAAKYLDDSVDLIVPADLPDDVSGEVRRLSALAFDALGCEGLARVDFFVTPETSPTSATSARVVINEINTMPGFTAISMFPRMWAQTGLDYPSLVDHLVAEALRRSAGLR